jgi:hypothetical protein
MYPTRRLALGIAEVQVNGPWEPDLLAERARGALGKRRLEPLTRRVVAAFPIRPASHRLADFLLTDRAFLRLHDRRPLVLRHGIGLRPSMAPATGPPSNWPVPAIATLGELADRLKLEHAELDWLADRRGLERRVAAEPLRNYRYHWIPKRDGASRLLEAPKPRLKSVQRKILSEILSQIPPHDAAHGFERGRSVRSFVDGHAGQYVVVRLDLRDFFPSITSARVAALLRTAGYPEPVALALAGLCTNRPPARVWSLPAAPADPAEAARTRQLYRMPHLPQGAPTSPALANLCAYRLDARLMGLADASQAHYTRYADDLAFSGDVAFARRLRRLIIQAVAIAIEEGFQIHWRKSRIMRQSVRQRVAGVVLNDRPNVPRADFDALKATLHNCLQTGPESQNRQRHPNFQAHLAGRVAHVQSLNPDRGRKLKAMLDQVVWS